MRYTIFVDDFYSKVMGILTLCFVLFFCFCLIYRSIETKKIETRVESVGPN